MSKKNLIKWSAVIMMSGMFMLNSQASEMPDRDSEAWNGIGTGKGSIPPNQGIRGWFRDNRNWFESIKGTSQDGIVFVGDSIFGNMGANPENTSRYFPGYRIVNRAIGGDTTRGVLWRLQEDVLDLNPKALVVLIGSNDLSAHAKKEDGVVNNIKDILVKASAAKPDMPIILCTILPRKSPVAAIDNQWLLDVNDGIRDLSSEKNVTIVDAYSVFLGENGEPNPDYFEKDLLHLNKTKGYPKLAEILTPVFEKLNLPKS
jgi:lysophospholipase L1-like esterase